MEFLTLEEIAQKASEIQICFNRLMGSKSLVGRRSAKQWQFLRACFKKTLGLTEINLEYTSSQFAQYKFEVETKLREFYLRGGEPVNFVFSLVHNRAVQRNEYPLEERYPPILTGTTCLFWIAGACLREASFLRLRKGRISKKW